MNHPITYPARPLNGGPLPKALPKSGPWSYEPKYNGWRALVHAPTGTMFNRKGEDLTIAGEFKPALQKLKAKAASIATTLEWFDCEALERRHNIGRGTLIVLDYVSHQSGRSTDVPYDQRRFTLQMTGIPEHSSLNVAPANDSIYLVVSYPGKNRAAFEAEQKHLHLWDVLQQCNKALGCEFYEGLVTKRTTSNYPIQLRNPDSEFHYWVKHRWAW